MRLMFVVNVDWFFLSHRLPVALEAQRQGYEVHVATTLTTRQEELRDYGFVVHSLPMARSSANLGSTVDEMRQMKRLFDRVRPDIVHLVTIKPVLLGGLVARFVRVPAVVAAISGLGYVFVARGWRAAVRRWMISWLYRAALAQRNLCAIFQNRDDAQAIVRAARLDESRICLIPGSGVDLWQFRVAPCAPGPLLVVMAARLLSDKGVREFVEAARRLRTDAGIDAGARFALVGEIDEGNPASLSASDLDRLRAEGVVELWGHQHDMASVLAQAHVVVLPSYREGMPKVLLEAAAVGRPVVTTDVPGCRDAIIEGETGLLVPARDAAALAAAVERLLADSDLRARFGQAARRLAETRFDLRGVVAQHLSIYARLSGHDRQVVEQ